MRFPSWMIWVVLVGCGDAGQDGAQAGQGGGDNHVDAGQPQGGRGGQGASGQRAEAGGKSSNSLQLPRIYPLVRAGTPAGLINDPADQNPGDPSLEMIGEDAGMRGPGMGMGMGMGSSLAQIIRERLYTPGPTELLRIIRELDMRTAGIDTDRTKHPCLAGAAVECTWTFPGGQTFRAHLQCLQEWAGGWVAFGFAPSDRDSDDAGVSDNTDDFFLAEGQDGGMGGLYRVRGKSGKVEAWITVADRRVPSNSQVVMHLAVDAADGVTELTLAGSGVGFCSAHLRTADNYLFIRAKPNAPPPPGAPIGHYCEQERSGCFSTTELNMDLGSAANSCRRIAAASFALRGALDASADPEANVTPGTIYEFFEAKPAGIPSY